VITGGEPLLYNLNYLTSRLRERGIRTFIETSGAWPLSGSWDWICLSPKKFKPPAPDIAKSANELKVIVFNKSDFEWAEEHAAMVPKECKLYLQPEWSKATQMTPLIVAYVMNNPKWEISLQTHKYLNIP
jgi:organic radical activating enzyme